MNKAASFLKTKIKNTDARIGVIGMGYVGLPLVKTFLAAGFNVLGFDIDEKKVKMLEERIRELEQEVKQLRSGERPARPLRPERPPERVADAEPFFFTEPVVETIIEQQEFFADMDDSELTPEERQSHAAVQESLRRIQDLLDSIPPEDQARGETAIREALEAMSTADRAAVVVFGQDALIERLASGDPSLPDLTSVPVTTRTDIGSALQLAMALFPDEGAKRLVLLSDGRENVGHALSQSELAAAQEIELLFVSLGGREGEAEVVLEELDAPSYAREGQDLDLRVLVRSTVQTNAALRVFGDGTLVHSQEIRLQPGLNRFSVPIGSVEAEFAYLMPRSCIFCIAKTSRAGCSISLWPV